MIGDDGGKGSWEAKAKRIGVSMRRHVKTLAFLTFNSELLSLGATRT